MFVDVGSITYQRGKYLVLCVGPGDEATTRFTVEGYADQLGLPDFTIREVPINPDDKDTDRVLIVTPSNPTEGRS